MEIKVESVIIFFPEVLINQNTSGNENKSKLNLFISISYFRTEPRLCIGGAFRPRRSSFVFSRRGSSFVLDPPVIMLSVSIVL